MKRVVLQNSSPDRVAFDGDVLRDTERETVDLTHETAAAWHGFPSGWTQDQRASRGYRVWLKTLWRPVM